MAGNVREWVHNKAFGEERAILGCYLDDDYSFNDYSSQHAMDRSSGNGLRVARILTRRRTQNRSRRFLLKPGLQGFQNQRRRVWHLSCRV